MATPTALVLVRSFVRDDPRVARQIDGLVAEGWTVDSLGLGEAPDGVRDHFAVADQAKWTVGRIGRGLMHALLPNRAKFRLLATARFPREAAERVRRGEYSLIVFNDIDFIPWVGDASVFTPAARAAHIHLDIHEWFPPHLPPGSRLRIRVDSYHVFLRSFIAHPAFTTRTTVASGIADAYAAELGIPRPGLVRNAPPFVDQAPSPVVDDRIRIVHHGGAQWERGLREVVDAMRLLGDRFEMTYMLAGSKPLIDELRRYAADLGERVRIVPPVAMTDLAREVNQYDLEVMFYPPLNENLRFALPNKLFEAVQGRLGLVIGPSPMMTEIIETHGNGIIAGGWTPADLAAALERLTPARVRELKAASDRAAHELSAEHERAEFLRIVGAR